MALDTVGTWFQAGSVLQVSAKPKLAHLTVKQRSVIRHSTEHVSTAPQASVCVLYTTLLLYLTSGIGPGDVRPCEAMETHSMTLPPHSFCVYINASGCSELFSCGISRAFFFYFFCFLLLHPVSNSVAYSCCDGGILLQYHA